MKKYISAVFFSSAFLSAAPLALATTLCPGGKFNVLCNGNLDVGTILSNFVSWIFVLAVVFALFYLIWGGFKWLTSGGDKTALQTAREHIIAAIVGLIIIFLSYFILNLIINFFIPGFKLNQFDLPTINGSASSSCIPAGNVCGGSQGLNCCGANMCQVVGGTGGSVSTCR